MRVAATVQFRLVAYFQLISFHLILQKKFTKAIIHVIQNLNKNAKNLMN